MHEILSVVFNLTDCRSTGAMTLCRLLINRVGKTYLKYNFVL